MVTLILVLTLPAVAAGGTFRAGVRPSSGDTVPSGGETVTVRPGDDGDAAASASLVVAALADPHVGYGPGTELARRALAEVADLEPALVLVAGDVTERGLATEYETWDSLAGTLGEIPLLAVPGNHDVRWSDGGKPRFAARLGGTTCSYAVGGVHFIGLDSTVAGETHGHFDRNQLEWVEDELQRLGPDAPVIVFCHHPPAFPVSFADNDAQLLDILARYDVDLVLAGHGHLAAGYNYNGVDLFMLPAVMGGSWVQLNIDGGVAHLVLRQIGGPASEVFSADLGPGPTAPAPQLTLTDPEEEALVGDSLAVRAEVAVAGGGSATVECRVDQGPWFKLHPKPRLPDEDGPAREYALDLNLVGTVPGDHVLTVRAADAARRETQVQRRFVMEPPEGERLWVRDVQASLLAGPEIFRSLVLTVGTEGVVQAHHLDGRTRAWRFNADAPVAGGLFIYRGTAFFGTDSGRLYGVNASSGRRLWSVRLDGPVLGTPVARGGRVYVGCADGQVYAVRADNGRVLWRRAIGGLAPQRPATDSRSIFVGSTDGHVYCLDKGTGEVRWQRKVSRNIYYAPAWAPMSESNGRVYVPTPPDGNNGGWGLHCLDADTGDLLWQRPGSFGYSEPVVSGDRLYLTTTRGDLCALDARDGATLWQTFCGEALFGSPAVNGRGQVVAVTINGRLVCADADYGQLVWRYKLDGGYGFGTPAVNGRQVLMGTLGGCLYNLLLPR